MVFIDICENDILKLGIELVGFSTTSPNTDAQRFKLTYGIHHGTAKIVFDKLQALEGDATIVKIDPFYYFVTLHWIYNYLKETLMCSLFKIRSGTTLRKYTWQYMEAIQALKEVEVGNFISKTTLMCTFTNFISFLH